MSDQHPVDDRLHLSPPHVTALEEEYVLAALRSGWVAPAGPDVTAFEDDVCAATGIAHAAALSSGTAGIHLALLALGVTAGQRVYVPTFTFGATAFAVTYVGAKPVFLDCEETSWNLDPDLLAATLAADAARDDLPAAIVTVDLFGRTCDYDRIMPLADQYGVPVVEDAAEALGAWHGFGENRRAAGSFGAAGIFSFNGNKIMTTSGGGMLVAEDAARVEYVRHLATQARDPFPWYEHTEIGFNYRLSNILAALGRAQLQRLPEMIERRRVIRERYIAALTDLPGIEVLGDPPWGTCNAWLTNARFDPSRYPDAPMMVRKALGNDNIESRLVWKPMDKQPVFAGAESHLTGMADAIFHDALSLPSGSAMTDDDVDRVLAIIHETLR